MPPSPLEHFHRHAYDRAVRLLTPLCGHHEAESAVQEAFFRALRSWTPTNMPADPSAWLLRVSRRCAIDALRQRKRLTSTDLETLYLPAPDTAPDTDRDSPDSPPDTTLRQLFALALPDLPPITRAMLLLRYVCELTTSQIARVFRIKESAAAQRLSRARADLSPSQFSSDPSPTDLHQRLPWVLESLYLTFSTGFHEIPAAHPSDDSETDAPHDPADSLELVSESLRLAHLLHAHPRTATPDTAALLALFLFHTARLGSRRDPHGRLLSLAEQDRSLWHTPLIDRALQLLPLASTAHQLSDFHLQAAIAAAHATAPSYLETDWPQILSFYDLLPPTPPTRLARTVALSMAHGPATALPLALSLLDDPSLSHDHRTYALLADLHSRLHNPPAAKSAYLHAASLAPTPQEKSWLLSQIP